MNPKLILAFVGGAVLASGVMFLGMKRLEQRAATRPVHRLAAPEVRAEAPTPPKVLKVRATPPQPAADRAPRQTEPRIVEKPRLVAKASPVAQHAPPASPVHVPKPSAMPRPEAPVPAVQVEQAPRIEAVSNPPVNAEPLEIPDPGPAPAHSVTLAAGSILKARIGETLIAARNKPGDRFLATLEEPLVIDGFIIAERGARMEGEVVTSERPARSSGVSLLAVRLVQFESADRQKVSISTKLFSKQGDSFGARDAGTVVATTALGAAIGAIAGGGKGAGIGAAVGGVAGVAGVAATRGSAATIPVETRIKFEVEAPIKITERLD